MITCKEMTKELSKLLRYLSYADRMEVGRLMVLPAGVPCREELLRESVKEIQFIIGPNTTAVDYFKGEWHFSAI